MSRPPRGPVGWYDERLHTDFTKKGYAQRFEVARSLVRAQTPFQSMDIFETRHFGRVLALDGIIQTTESDEFVYHEMMVHVPLFAHGAPRDVLIIGAGDGGILREVLRHKTVRRAVMVEIDGDVVRECARHMPALNGGAFKNPRGQVIIGDGIDYVRKARDKSFDAVLVDSTDIGPGESCSPTTSTATASASCPARRAGDRRRALLPTGRSDHHQAQARRHLQGHDVLHWWCRPTSAA